MSLVEELADEVVFLLEGNIYFKGTVTDLKSKTDSVDLEHAKREFWNHDQDFKYSFSDLTRSRWSFIYLAFYLLLGSVLLFLNNDLSKGIITLMNVIVVLTPMIGTIFGVMYFYNSRESSTELLLAQPVKRSVIFLGQYLGISISLSLSLVLGLGLPFLAYGLFRSGEIANFILLLTSGTLLTFIFVALSICIALFNSNKIKGFGCGHTDVVVFCGDL